MGGRPGIDLSMIRLTPPPSVPPAGLANATCLTCGEELYLDPEALPLGASAICPSCLEGASSVPSPPEASQRPADW